MMSYISARTKDHPETDREALIVDIVRTIADTKGVDPLDLPPLNEYVDVDALVTLVESANRGEPSRIAITFRYEGYDIEIQSDGTVDVTSLASTRASIEGVLSD